MNRGLQDTQENNMMILKNEMNRRLQDLQENDVMTLLKNEMFHVANKITI